MTEVRIYPDHDKIVVTHELADDNDVLLELVSDHEEWRDEEYAYYRMSLSEFMQLLQKQ